MDYFYDLFQETEKYDYEKALMEDKTPIVSEESEYSKTLGFEKINTIWDIVKYSAENYKDFEMLGKRRLDDESNPAEYVWHSYKETFESVNKCSSGIYHVVGALNGDEQKSADFNRFLERGKRDDEKETTEEEGKDEQEIREENDIGGKDDSEKIDYFEDKYENIGIYSVNRPEWMITALSTTSISMKPIALYDTLGKDSVSYIINHANIRIVFCSKDKIRTIIDAKKEKELGLLVIVQMDFNPKYNNKNEYVCEELKKEAEEAGVRLIGFGDFLKFGESKLDSFTPRRPKEDNLAIIMYTSGTSGTPKGVMLTHKNAISAIKNVLKTVDLSGHGKFLSFLPLAHILEFAVEIAFISCGYSIGYYSGSPKLISGDIKELRPHIFAAVPRLFERMYDKVISKSAETGFFTRNFFQMALRNGVRNSRLRPSIGKPSSFDWMVWSKIRREIGLDRVRHVLSGGAPCPEHIMEFLRVLFPCPVLQGYGLTETFAILCLSAVQDPHLSHTGNPVGCEIRLEKVQDTEYDPEGEQKRGEILVRGPQVFVGYYKQKDLTREVLSEDGWFRTGDVGRLNPNGSISIIDRKKSLFKLSQGEYISPEQLEAVYSNAIGINQIFVYGNSMKNYVVAVIVPTGRWCLEFFNSLEEKLNDEQKEALLQAKDGNDPEKVQKAMSLIGKQYREEATETFLRHIQTFDKELRRFELVRRIYIEFDVDVELNGFTVGNELLTPSFKLRRPILSKRYESVISELYSETEQTKKLNVKK